jgi:hypothetical protein
LTGGYHGCERRSPWHQQSRGARPTGRSRGPGSSPAAVSISMLAHLSAWSGLCLRRLGATRGTRRRQGAGGLALGFLMGCEHGIGHEGPNAPAIVNSADLAGRNPGLNAHHPEPSWRPDMSGSDLRSQPRCGNTRRLWHLGGGLARTAAGVSQRRRGVRRDDSKGR